MKQIWFIGTAALALSSVGCNGDAIVAPPTTETIAVTVVTRSPDAGEVYPSLEVIPGAGTISFKVTRQALCQTIVTAGLNRTDHALSIVSHVSSDPAAFCLANPAVVQLVDYSGTIAVAEAGRYGVRVFEGEQGRDPVLVGSGTVLVPTT
jgi:hypothetical protein